MFELLPLFFLLAFSLSPKFRCSFQKYPSAPGLSNCLYFCTVGIAGIQSYVTEIGCVWPGTRKKLGNSAWQGYFLQRGVT